MLAACLLLVLGPAPAQVEAVEPVVPAAVQRLLAAMEEVETGGEPDRGRDARGDDGRSIGPLQIQRAYWLDARVPGRYEQCRDPRYARSVVLAYWARWCPHALESADLRTLARIHNGGPRGAHKPSTLTYWRRVRAALHAADETEHEQPAPRPRPRVR